MAKELDEFLGGEEELPVAEVVAEPVVEAPEAAAQPETPAPEPAEPAKEPEPTDVTGLRSALLAERTKRNDYKGERDRLAGEKAAMQAELEAFRKAAVPAPPPQQKPAEQSTPVSIPSPIEDPAGYHAHIQRDIFNRSLNMSEVMLRQQVGDDADVDAKVAAFKKLAEANPALRAELQRHPHPYKFVYDHAKKAMAMDEIGGDPAAFRANLEAEIRAKIEAEYAGAGAQPAAQQRVTLPQSLGTVRSAGPRSGPVLNVPESFDDILRVARK